MIVVRNTFIAKPGSASKLAKLFKDAASAVKIAKFRVMTDMIGDFNTVVLEFEGETMQDFEAQMHQYESDPTYREQLKGYTDLYLTGKREIFKVV